MFEKITFQTSLNIKGIAVGVNADRNFGNKGNMMDAAHRIGYLYEIQNLYP